MIFSGPRAIPFLPPPLPPLPLPPSLPPALTAPPPPFRRTFSRSCQTTSAKRDPPNMAGLDWGEVRRQEVVVVVGGGL